MPQHEKQRTVPLLRLLVEALEARQSPEHPAVAAALYELGRLARLQIPAHGALPLSDDQLFNAVDKIAAKHLDLDGARDALDVALANVHPLSSRDGIEVAIAQFAAVLNVAYFHAGLAFGVTLSDLRSS